MKELKTPISREEILQLQAGDAVRISGLALTGVINFFYFYHTIGKKDK